MVLIFLSLDIEVVRDEAQALIPYISNGALISWMYPVSESEVLAVLGVSEWTSEHSYCKDFGVRQPEFWVRSAELRRSWYHNDHSFYAGRLGSICRRFPQ